MEAWADVAPLLEEVDSVEELREAVSDPVGLLLRLHRAGGALGTVEKERKGAANATPVESISLSAPSTHEGPSQSCFTGPSLLALPGPSPNPEHGDEAAGAGARTGEREQSEGT